ncbi:MAG: glycosyltransferase family 1 protein, partial [Candidatus Aenigmarchaeota archaeon]|nr:glycosyltransferase family 1 protein [Candidatus Aenigmarchaeota archaeon]
PEVAGDAAIFFDPYNPQDIAEKLVWVLEDRGLGSKLSKKGAAQAKKFSWRRMAQQTLKVYETANS